MKSIAIFSHFTKILFSKQTGFKQNDWINYLDKIDLPILSNGQKQICDAIITRKNYDFKLMENNKTRGNDGLSKEFYEGFLGDVKISLLASNNDALKKN